MSLPASIRDRLRLPVVAAPMFLVSGPALVRAAQGAGIVGAFPANNARFLETLDAWMGEIAGGSPADAPPWALNVMTHRTYARLGEELEIVARWKPPIVITALGGPGPVLETVKAYGGLVFADVNSLTYAEKAVKAGADGLVLVASGAGGHTGALSAFAFVSAVREMFDGPICLGGGIGTGRAVRAAEVLGADLAYMGTRFIACEESLAEPAYKAMLIEANAEHIVLSAAMTGAPANWLRGSLMAAGLDPNAMEGKAEMALGRPEDAKKRWRDVWSAGHGVGAVHRVEPLAAIVDDLARDYAGARGPDAASAVA